jgi:hypothetical protein
MTVFWLIAIWFVATCCLNEHQRKINGQRHKEQDSRDWYEAGIHTPHEPAPYDRELDEKPMSREEFIKALRGEA